MSQPEVAIIGGGFAGPVLALALKKHNITSAIYETRGADYSQGGNIALAPNALRVLDHIGVYDQISTKGYHYSELRFDNGKGEVLGKFLNGSRQIYNFDAIRIHRSIVRDELIAEVEKQQIPIYYNKKCTGITEETPTSATVSFEDGESVTASYVVGTDGIHSKIRPYIAPDTTTPTFSGFMGIMGTVSATELDASTTASLELPCMLFGATGSFAIMPSSFSGDELGYFATLEAPEGDRGRQGWADLEHDKAELRRMLEQRFSNPTVHWPPLVRALVDKTPPDTLTSWPFFSVPHLRSWTSAGAHPRVLVVGDAAHAIPPMGGQGAAMALEDAETLAYVLARVSLSSAPPAAVFAAWHDHRSARIARVVDFTTKNGALRKASPHLYEQAAKEWLIWAVFKFMGPEGGARWMYGYNAESVLACLP